MPPLTPDAPPRTPTFVSRAGAGTEPVAGPAAELTAGLQAQPAAIAPKYFYDPLGSALFTAITELPEYYPTRTEAAILQACGAEIAGVLRAALPPGFDLVDLGAGDGAKAARLFGPLAPGRYIAVDISEAYLRQALDALQRRFPALPMVGVGLDFAARLALPEGLPAGPALVFYPGSSIGNFAPPQALRLLREARALARGGALLIGADLVKPPAVLEAAYDDALGVTAAFNRNLLSHVNRLLGSDFELADWKHRALFNAAESRIEMHLQAQRALTVRWPGGERRFGAGERIHTESSYKWQPAAFEALLRQAGWRQVQCFSDPLAWFGVFLAQG
ncbi:MAG: L-histidine N(alpha)-methyltransferase [Burkholderiales bacterium]|nr:L-histidine N(alpha)-methyltransferase [Burkholderiales bacterium]